MNPRSYGGEAAVPTVSRAAIRFALGAELAVLGGLALWPPLRTRTQSRLAAIGEGVAAAAGIASLLAGSASLSTDEVVKGAAATFRSVRADLLEPKHLSSNEPSAAAYALSSSAKIGSVDVRRAPAAAPPLAASSAPMRCPRGARAASVGNLALYRVCAELAMNAPPILRMPSVWPGWPRLLVRRSTLAPDRLNRSGALTDRTRTLVRLAPSRAGLPFAQLARPAS